MNITLPGNLAVLLGRKAAQAGFARPEEYALHVLSADLDRDSDPQKDALLREAMTENGDLASVTPEMLEQRKREIEPLLLAGLDSGPAVPMTTQDWEDIRRELRDRRQTRNIP